MKITHRIAVAVCTGVVLSANLAGCSGLHLPESYGFYARDGSRLIRLDDKTPQTERGNLAPSATLIIFDRRLSMAAVKPEEIAKIFVRRYIRFNVDQQHDQSGAPPVDFIITRADSFGVFGSALDCLIIPIKGQTEMVEVKPKQPLPKGLYYLIFDNERIPFGVGIGSTQDNQSEFSGAVDRYNDSLTKKAAFSWDSWVKATLRGPGSDNHHGGDVVDEKNFADVTKLNAMIDGWKKDFGDKINRKDFPECAKIVRRLKSFDPQDTAHSTQLGAALAGAAQEFLGKDPQVAVALANRALMVSPDDMAAKKVSDAGTHMIKDWNDQQDLQKKNWLKIANTDGKTVAKYRYLESTYDSKPALVFRITERSLFYGDKSGRGRKIQLQNIYYAGSLGGNSVRIIADGLQGSGYFDFLTEKERVAFTKSLSKAMMKSNSTVGSVHRSVEGDNIIFTVDVEGAAWSPIIKLPDNYASVVMETPGFYRRGIIKPDGTIKAWDVYDGFNPSWPSGQKQFTVSGEQGRGPSHLKFTVTLP